jgi:hypothetical protein
VVVFFDFGQKGTELLITLMILNNLIKNIKDEKNYKHNLHFYIVIDGELFEDDFTFGSLQALQIYK